MIWAPSLAPEGHLTIAQRFIAGFRIAGTTPFRPVGTIEGDNVWFRCPYGTPRAIRLFHPAMKSLGYFQPSLRDEIRDALQLLDCNR